MIVTKVALHLSLTAVVLPSAASYAAPEASFSAQDMNMFYRMWRDGRVLHKAAKGLPRLSMRGLHDTIMKRPYLPADRRAEAAILQSFRRSGLYPSPNHALKATCRGDICETLFVERKRPRRTKTLQDGAYPLEQASLVAGKACRPNYPASMVGGDRDGYAQGGMAFFCIANDATGV